MSIPNAKPVDVDAIAALKSVQRARLSHLLRRIAANPNRHPYTREAALVVADAIAPKDASTKEVATPEPVGLSAEEALVPDSAHQWAKDHYIAFADFSDPEPANHVPFGRRAATWRDAPTTWGEVAARLAAIPASDGLVAGVVALAMEIEDPRIQRPGMQRRRIWADRLRAFLAGPEGQR